METSLKLVAALLAALYFLAGINYAVLFFRGASVSRRTATPFLLSVAVLHLAAVGIRSSVYGRCPLGDFPEVLSLLALSLVAVYLVLEFRQRNPYTGVFLLALVVPIMIASAALQPGAGSDSPLLRTMWFGFHTTLALLGYAGFAVSAVYAFMFLLLHRALKRQTFGLIFDRLPPLDVLARMTEGAAVIGFLALTIASAIGILWGSRLISGFWSDPKILLTFVIWGVYGAGILARYRLRWSSRPIAVLFLTGFLVVVISVVMLNTILRTFHAFGGGA